MIDINEIVPLSLAVFSLSVALSALAYLIGSSFNLNELKAWSKQELKELIFSAILLILLLSYFSLFVDLFSDYSKTIVEFPEGYSNPCDVAQAPCFIVLGVNFLDNMILETDNIITSALRRYSLYTFIDNLHFSLTLTPKTAADQTIGSLGLPGGLSLNPFKSFTKQHITVVYALLKYFLFPILLLLFFIKNAVFFFSYYAAPYLILSGVVLRSLKFSRKLGGLLLAIGFAALFILPSVFLLGNAVYFDMKNSLISSGNQLNNNKPYLFTPVDFTHMLTSDWSGLKQYLSGEAPSTPSYSLNPELEEISKEDLIKKEEQTVSSFKSLISVLTSVGFLGYTPIEFATGDLVEGTAKIATFVFIFSMLALFATISATKSLAETFGGDIDIAGLSHLL